MRIGLTTITQCDYASSMDEISTGLERAIHVAGGVCALAEKLGVKQTRVSQWKKRKRIPPTWIVPIENVTGVPREELAPEFAELYRRDRRTSPPQQVQS
jgi:DNA-binding transcriptional regulator YdaS (Cro superfamily)